MKHLKLFFALFAMLALGVGNAWGAEESFTIHDKFTSTTMAYATTYTADISVSDLNGGNSTVGISVLGVYKQAKAGTTFQTNKKSGHIKNTSAIPGKITKIVVSHNSSYQKNTLKVYGAKGQEATTESTLIGTLGTKQTDETISFETGEYNYFLIDPSTGTGSAQMTSITIYYTSSSGSEGGDDPETPGEGGGEDPEEPGTGTSGEVTFVFDTDQGLSELGITKPNASAGTNLGSDVYTKAPINMTATDGSTATRVWNSSGATTLRVYKSTGSLTFSSEATINKIVFNTSITATASVGTLSGTTWTGEAKEVKFTFTANATIKTITVAYTAPSSGSGSGETVASLVQIAHTGDKTTFTEGDAFVKSTITATYDDATTKDVTSLATFTGYDMNTTGTQTVNVEYEGKTTSYTITVNPKPTYTITWNNAGTTNETTVVQGAALGELPTVAECSNGKKFMGWTAVTEVNNDGSGIVYVKETDIPTENTTYYAVFAVVTSTGEPVTSYKKVTTISDGTYLIAATNGSSSYAYTGQVEGKNFGGYIGVTIENDEIITKPVEATEITVQVSDGKFSMHDGTSYLYLSAAGKNELHFTNTEKVDWILDEGKIKNSSITTEHRYLQFNSASGSERFACYKSTQKDAFLYKKVTTTPATVSDYSLDCTIHTEPTWTISKDAIDFADKYVGISYTETFTINASNLTDDIALAIVGSNFTVSPTLISKDATFPQTVTVTYAPTAAESHNATLNITSGSTLSKSIALTGSATEATIYTLTALADIKPTDKVIIVGTTTNGTYAMSNDNGTSEAPDAVAVEVADNKIATNETNILWNIAKNDDNLTIYPADQTAKWLYCLADDNNGVRVGTGNAKEFTIDKGYLYTTQTTSARHIGIYNNADWRCYKPSGDAIANNIKDQSFAFYVLPNTDPSISVSPASKDFGAVASGETATQEFEITTMNLTQALYAELTGEGFTKSNIVDNKITITFAPTEEKDYSATLTISAGTEATASVTISGKGAAATYTVTYNSNGATGAAPTDATKYIVGDKVTVAGQGDMTYAGYRFTGWKYGEDIYKAGAKFTMPAENVTFVAQWEEKANFSEGFWVLVTDGSELATDDYVVIAAADYNVAMKSYESGNNCKQVNITKVNDFLIWNENVGVFQLAKEGENYTFQDVNTEQYLYAAGTGTNNYLKAANEVPSDADAAKPYIWTILYTDGVATVKATSENRNTLMYNATEGTNGQLFSCYASNQKAIALYKYVTDYTYTHTPTNKYGTICLPYASASTSGAYFYEVVGKGAENGEPAVYLASVNSLKAGVPYIFEATASTITVTYQGEAVAEAGTANGLVGTFVETTVPDGDYILYNNAFCTNEPAGTLNKIRANRAYLNWAAIEGGAPVQMPGRRYIGMDVQGENVETGVEDLFTTDAPVKVIENGQLIIIRDGVKYNVQGQKL